RATSAAWRMTRRAALIARLMDQQSHLRRRFEAVRPTGLGTLDPTVRELLANTTFRQHEVLRLVSVRGPLAMHELAQLLGVSRSSATEVVDRLVAHGLLERRQDPIDRRAVQVALTERAQGLAAQVRRALEPGFATLVSVLDDGELATLVGLLEKLAKPASPTAAVVAPSSGLEPRPPGGGRVRSPRQRPAL
ncbi:MAG TPA: MarR family transcriptional regulator, partial [Candidatus Saccharimonadales bacterium]|nr:MarR family transcriptional regulator [Candidatus Saccharimonadales bacterium]